MKIQILSRQSIIDNRFVSCPNAIIISSPQTILQKSIAAKFSNILYLKFHDVMLDQDFNSDLTYPTLQDVENALQFAANLDDLVVACFAGKSRSSAIAYVIMCSKMPPDKAIKILNRKYHHPNMYIVKLAAEILGEKIIDEYIEWLSVYSYSEQIHSTNRTN